MSLRLGRVHSINRGPRHAGSNASVRLAKLVEALHVNRVAYCERLLVAAFLRPEHIDQPKSMYVCTCVRVRGEGAGEGGGGYIPLDSDLGVNVSLVITLKLRAYRSRLQLLRVCLAQDLRAITVTGVHDNLDTHILNEHRISDHGSPHALANRAKTLDKCCLQVILLLLVLIRIHHSPIGDISQHLALLYRSVTYEFAFFRMQCSEFNA